MSEPARRPVAAIEAPYGRQVDLEAVDYESGLRLLRIRIREGRRFTVLEIDAETARSWADAMTGWAETAGPR